MKLYSLEKLPDLKTQVNEFLMKELETHKQFLKDNNEEVDGWSLDSLEEFNGKTYLIHANFISSSNGEFTVEDVEIEPMTDSQIEEYLIEEFGEIYDDILDEVKKSKVS